MNSSTRTLLAALLTGTAARRHILTVHTTHAMSTAVDLSGAGPHVEHCGVLGRLAAAVLGGRQAAVVLRSFTEEVSHILDNGTVIPVKHVRGWLVRRGGFHPLEESEMFAMHCIDASTGEPLAPERGVVYLDAWPVDLAAFHAERSEDG